MKQPISITALASISALGSTFNTIWNAYTSNTHYITKKQFSNSNAYVAQLSEDDALAIETLRQENSKYKNLDNSVLYAIHCARKAMKDTGWNANTNFGINIGSSRGATSLFETYHEEFLNTKTSSTLSSPTTTLGNISSWVAHDLQTQGPTLSHSITCSTALHAMLNGVAWLQSGLADTFLVGGSEAPLTEFTIAQMQALKVYAKSDAAAYPCRAFDLNKTKNTMVVGEGASVLCLEKGQKSNALATITGIGYATEHLEHNTSISADGNCFQKSMQMALGDIDPSKIDAVVMHAPGTVKGDLAEFEAIKKVFCDKLPFVTTNKWKLGHTFGASGLLSVELAIVMLQKQQAIAVPFSTPQSQPNQLQHIMVNAVGFGGNAVSILLSK